MAHVLKPWQEEALRYTRGRSRIALFMEMRLGKSPVAIRWVRDDRKARRVLLVAPQPTLIGRHNWEGELKAEGITSLVMLHRYEPDDRYARAQWQWNDLLIPTGLDLFGHFGQKTIGLKRSIARGWFLINYEALRAQPELLGLDWDCIVLDESTRIRNPQAQITKEMLKRCGHIENRAILSGLPNPEQSLDYYCQFQFLHDEFLGYSNFWAFRQRYYVQGAMGWDWAPKRGTTDTIKAYVHEHAFVKTQKQAGFKSEKVYAERRVPLNVNQRRMYRDLKRRMMVNGQETKWAPVVHTWMRKIAGGFTPENELCSDAKLKILTDLVTEEFRKQSVVVWFMFNHEIAAAQAWLKKHAPKVTVEAVTGETPVTKRPEIQDRFQSGLTRVILMQVALGQFGWNLSRANTAIYYSNSYEFEDRDQSENRIVHMTKEDDLLYIDLVTDESTDEDLVEAVQDKRRDAKVFTRSLASKTRARLSKVMAGDTL